MLTAGKVRFLAGALGVLALVGAGAGVADGRGSRQAKWVTVEQAWVMDTVEDAARFVAPDGSTTPPTGMPAPASMLFFREEIYEAAGPGTEQGARIGTAYGNCTVGTAGALCEAHASFPDPEAPMGAPRGTIELKFAFDFNVPPLPPGVVVPVRFSVTGGTGAFAGISGELIFYERQGDPNRAELDAVMPRQ